MKTQDMPGAKGSAALLLQRILVPVDFSPASNHAVEYASWLSGLTGADLIFVHVVVPDAPAGMKDEGPGICSVDLKENANENLRGLVRLTQDGGNARARSVTRCGLPAHEIVEEAKASRADLIVIASHGYTGWKHFCIGSTAERVVRAAPCPVLVVREKEHDFFRTENVKSRLNKEGRG